jgi:hypothetical protein
MRQEEWLVLSYLSNGEPGRLDLVITAHLTLMMSWKLRR